MILATLRRMIAKLRNLLRKPSLQRKSLREKSLPIWHCSKTIFECGA